MMGGTSGDNINDTTSEVDKDVPTSSSRLESPSSPKSNLSPKSNHSAPPLMKHPSTIQTSGPPTLTVLQEPQENFHKDEGGKANQLSFRIILQGELSEEILANAVDGCLPLNIKPVFEDGELCDPSVLDIAGGTDTANPAILLRTRLGGVRYRLRTVSKRLGNRGISVIAEVVNCPSIEPRKSEATMVFSKRKNKEQRLEEQARERNELLEKQRAAAALLIARTSPDVPMESSSSAGAAGSSLQPPMRFPVSSNSGLSLPPQFIPAAPAIVRPRPRRISRDKEHDTDSEASFDSAANSSTNASKRKKPKPNHKNRKSLEADLESETAKRKSLEERIMELEHETSKLRSSLESHIIETEEMRAAMNLCFYQLGGANAATSIRRSSSQNVPWDFTDTSSSYNHESVRDQLVGGLSMISPQPTRSPFEIEAWMNGATLNGAEPPLRLRRDISSGSQISSPRLHTGPEGSPQLGHPIPPPKRSASSESLS